MNQSVSHSTLDAAGRGAEQIAELFVWMTGGAFVIWIGVIGLAIYAVNSSRRHDRRQVHRWVIVGGAVFPTILLTALLTYGLSIMPGLHRPAPPGSLTVEVVGAQWWWRVRYLEATRQKTGGAAEELATVASEVSAAAPDEEAAGGRFSRTSEPHEFAEAGHGGRSDVWFETANEIVLPVDQPVSIRLQSADVIHSFWIPSLGGKRDMIPGRTNTLRLHPTRTGVFGGWCAEYCGGAHAQMRFRAIVLSQADFRQWMADQQSPADEPTGEVERRGQQVFLSRGCSACHAIRGTAADGVAGPDLTHFGSRLTVGAGVLENEPASLRRWIVETHAVKPGVKMPPFETLADRPNELRELVLYLESLQ